MALKKLNIFMKLVIGLFVFMILAAAGGYVVANQRAYDQPGNPRNKEAVARGRVLYADLCASCHGKNLEGQADWDVRRDDGSFPAPPHDVSGHTWHHDNAFLFDYIKSGGRAMNPPGFVSEMPKFDELVTDSEVWAVLAFIKSTWPAHIQEKQANR